MAFVPDVREDLARRDFTINAMAYSAEEGLCDPFGGQEDLARGVVRAVGEPLRRFEEDALRILRLYRFVARFGFVIDEATEAASASKKSWTSFCLPRSRGRIWSRKCWPSSCRNFRPTICRKPVRS